MRILIVDDDRMICAGNARRIVRMGFEEIEAVQCAYSGEEAMEILRRERFDVMFTDIRMAEMDGLGLVRDAKSIHPNLICIVITAFDRFQYAQQALRLGVEDFLVKPISEASMRKHVESAIAKYRRIHEEKELQLELEICAQVVAGQQDVDECFRRCGLKIPECAVCMAVWQEPAMNDPLPECEGAWLWRPRNGRFLLLAWEGEATLRRLNAAARRIGRFAGVSAAGRSLKEMSLQAEKALEFAWTESAPCAVRWTPQRAGGISGLRHGLLDQVRALNEAEARKILEGALRTLPDDCRQNARLLVEAAESELAEQRAALGMDERAPLTLTPGLGIPAMLRTLSEEIAAIRRAGTQPDALNPVPYAKHYAQEHLYEQIDMAVLANRLNLSYAYFSRIFREQAGTTFSRYLLSLRMQEVCRLLLNGEKLVDIAEKLCYQNAANLTRSFTREFGMSPSRWLEQQRKN